MSEDPIIDGIKQRQDSDTLDYSEAVIGTLELLFKDHDLPSPYEWHGDEYFGFMQDAAELVQRWHDAIDADRDKEVVFIERQIDAFIDREKARWRHLTESPQQR